MQTIFTKVPDKEHELFPSLLPHHLRKKRGEGEGAKNDQWLWDLNFKSWLEEVYSQIRLNFYVEESNFLIIYIIFVSSS